jgi:signal transduction histidine kinase
MARLVGDPAMRKLRESHVMVIGLGGVATDMTERKRLESKLVEAKEAAEAASKSRAAFLDIAAHELRTPVTAISLLLETVRRRIKKGQAVDTSVLTRLYEPVDRLARLVVDLLDISRLERGLIDLQWSPTDVVALASTCLSEFQLQAPLRQMSFKGPSEVVRVELDPVRINQVLSNLLDNAIRYTPGDTPIELYLEQRPNSVRFSVVDHGPGIPREQLGSLFQAFSRGKSEATIRSSGLGLGLSVCRGIVELHGGTIGVSSEVGRGSTFYFNLPLRRASV